ncbi:Transcription factor MYB104 [Zea mays]|nr:Transcription factor MYB104 [Zea mays]
MSQQTGHIQLGFFLTSNTLSPYLHPLYSVNPETTNCQEKRKQSSIHIYMHIHLIAIEEAIIVL